MIDTKELAPIKAQVSKLENQATAVTIVSQEGYENAIDLVSKLKETGSEIKYKKESITKPLNEALKHVRDMFRPVETQFENAERIIKTKLLDYKRKKDEEARAEEAKVAARVAKGTMKLETAEKKMDSIERVENTTRGQVGQVQIKKIRKVRVTDQETIPRKYLVPDMVLIRQDALSGIVIPGIEIYEEESIAAR